MNRKQKLGALGLFAMLAACTATGEASAAPSADRTEIASYPHVRAQKRAPRGPVSRAQFAIASARVDV